MEYAEIIERGRNIRMVLAMNGLIDLQCLQIHRFRLDMLALPCIDLRQLGEADSAATVLATEFFGLLYRYCEAALGFCIVALLHGLLPRRHGRFPGLLLTGEKK